MDNYESLKAHAPSPRRLGALAVAALLVYTTIAGMAGSTRALALTKGDEGAYAIKLTAERDADTIQLEGRVTDNATQTVLAAPTMKFTAGEAAEARAGNTRDELEIIFRVRPGAAGDPIVVEVTMDRAGRRAFARTLTVSPSDATAKESRKYTGAPMTLNLKDADLRDVLMTFGKLTGLTVIPDDAVQGRVSVSWTDVPWDQAFDEILRDYGLTYRLEGSTIHVTKR